MNTLKDKATFKQAFIDTLPVMSGYLIMGAGFGMVMNSYGYPPYLSTLMAVCIYAGAMQYVGANLYLQEFPFSRWRLPPLLSTPAIFLRANNA